MADGAESSGILRELGVLILALAVLGLFAAFTLYFVTAVLVPGAAFFIPPNAAVAPPVSGYRIPAFFPGL